MHFFQTPWALCARRSGLIFVLSLALPHIAAAQATSTTKLTGDVGFVSTSGNTDVTTLTINEKLGFAKLGWGLEQSFGVVYGTDSGTVNTSLWRAGLRGERNLVSRLFAVAGVAWDKNRFAGIQSRFEEFLGLRYRAIVAPRDSMDLQLAGSLTQQENIDDTSDSFPAARLGLNYKHLFSSKAYLTETVEYIPNLDETDDYRLNNELALVAPVSEKIGVKLAYVVRFDNVPAATFKKTDTFFTAGIQLTF